MGLGFFALERSHYVSNNHIPFSGSELHMGITL